AASPFGQNPNATAPMGGRMPRGRGIPPPEAAQAQATPAATGAKALSKNTATEVSVVTILFRAVNLASPTLPSANTDIAFATEGALQASPMFDKAETQIIGTIDAVDASGTFTFEVNLKLKRPMKL